MTRAGPVASRGGDALDEVPRARRAGCWIAWSAGKLRTFALVLATGLAVLAWGRSAAAVPRLEPAPQPRAVESPHPAITRLPPVAARAGRITVLAEPGLGGVARALADGAQRALDRIAADLPDLPVPRAIEVRLVRDTSDLPAVAPPGRGAPAWAIGVAYPDLGVISVATRRGAVLADPQATLRHELAHVALAAALGDRAPHWLHEGFAYQHTGEWSWERTETLAGMAWTGGIIPLDELDRTFPQDEQPANRAYAESYDFVGFLRRRGRWEDPSDDGDRWPFRRFLREIGQGIDLDSAARHQFGKPLHQLFEEWRNDLSSRYMLVPVGLLGLALWILCAILLGLAWWRRRRQNRRRLAQWDLEERRDDRATSSSPVTAPPYVPWPGEDPLGSEPDDDDQPPPPPPRWIN